MKRKKKKQKNIEIVLVTYLFVILFISMMGYFVYFVYAKSGEVMNSPYNTRQELLANKVVRGKILSKYGHIFA